VAAASVVAAALACGCGTPADQARHVAAFDRLVVADGVTVQVVRGDRPGVTVHGREDVLSRVVTESSGGRLRVAIRDRGIVIGPDPMHDVRVRVTAPRLRDVRVDGAGDIDLGDVAATALRFEISGTGDVRARGRADRLDAVVHGAADANLADLAVRDARVEIRGAASMTLNVSERLDVEIHGAGDVRYAGHPVVTRDVQGAGDVTQVP
jgi:hypothetical protein